jgi:hypothetical protein
MEKILFPFDFFHRERRLAAPLCGHANIASNSQATNPSFPCSAFTVTSPGHDHPGLHREGARDVEPHREARRAKRRPPSLGSALPRRGRRSGARLHLIHSGATAQAQRPLPHPRAVARRGSRQRGTRGSFLALGRSAAGRRAHLLLAR